MCPGLAEPMSRSELASVPVSKLGKTDLVFVQPGAKIKCLLLSEHTRTRFTLGNSPYLEQRLRIPAGWSACAPFT